MSLCVKEGEVRDRGELLCNRYWIVMVHHCGRVRVLIWVVLVGRVECCCTELGSVFWYFGCVSVDTSRSPTSHLYYNR